MSRRILPCTLLLGLVVPAVSSAADEPAKVEAKTDSKKNRVLAVVVFLGPDADRKTTKQLAQRFVNADRFEKRPVKDGPLKNALRVGVAPEAGKDDFQPMLGKLYRNGDALAFIPEFPFQPGVKYRATFAGTDGKTLRHEFTLRVPKPDKPAEVLQVYPTTNVVPENLLKFYVHFSVAMSRGEAYRRITLLDAAGKPIDRPFLELAEELWTPSGTRFTLFFDPGRIKRGLKPREDVGPALEQGKSYTLVVDRKWESAAGFPLQKSFRKSFRVGPPDEKQPDVNTWKVVPPKAGSKNPLVVDFPESLDAAMLQRVLTVANADGKAVDGRITLSNSERRWEFRPDKPWSAGKYKLVAATILEDLAGNSIGRPFEVDLESPPRKPAEKTATLSFEVR